MSEAKDKFREELKIANKNWAQRVKARLQYDQAREAEAQEAEINATIDPLTGLWNRRGFDKVAKEILELADRKGKSVSAMMIDVDHFKQYNDTYGHVLGDKALRGLATLLGLKKKGSVIRASDLVARYGGEEFIVLLADADLKTAMKIGERLRAFIEQESNELDLPSPFTVSIGLVQIGDEDLTDAINRADEALYEAKKKGRNRIECAEIEA